MKCSFPERWLCGLVAGLWLVAIARAEAPLSAAYTEGLAAEEHASGENTPVAERQTHLRLAVDKYRQVVHARPDYREAREHLASCLLSLIDLAAAPEKPGAIDAAGEEVDRLAADPGATADDYLRRAMFLVRYRYRAATSTEAKQRAFELTRPVFDTAIAKAASPTARAAAQVSLANLLTVQAGVVTDAVVLRKMYREAATLFEGATRVSPDLLTPAVQHSWGLALLHIGRLDHDLPTARSGLQLLEGSLQGKPGNAVKRYNLACAHAVVGEPKKALELLAGCLKEDSGHTLYHAARTDPDWAELRGSPEFAKLLQRYDPAVDQAFDEGLRQQAAGERAAAPEVRADYFRKAYQKYLEATQSRPDFYRAHFNALVCLRQLFGLAQERPEKERLLAVMNRHFKAAAQSPGVNGLLYERQGIFLLQDGQRLVEDPAKKLAILQESKEALEEANKRVTFTGDRARVAIALARCNLALASVVTDPAVRRPLLEQALAQFEVANRIEQPASTPEMYVTWGTVQLDLAKLDGDRFGLRRSIDSLQLALKGNPRHLPALYNIACAYALLGQADDAILYLRQCLQFDTAGRFAGRATTDPDLQSLRTRDDFKKLFASPPPGRPFSIEQTPPLSER